VEERVRAAEKGGKAVNWVAMVKPVTALAEEQGCKVIVGSDSIRRHYLETMLVPSSSGALFRQFPSGGSPHSDTQKGTDGVLCFISCVMVAVRQCKGKPSKLDCNFC